MNVEVLKKHLIQDEGRVPHAYPDHLGYLTIGVGHLIDQRLGGRLDDDVIDHQLANDIERVEKDLQTFPWWYSLSEARQVALANMRFQLGPTKFRGFRKMLEAITEGDWVRVAEEAKDSRWYHQTQESRTTRVIHMLRFGVYP